MTDTKVSGRCPTVGSRGLSVLEAGRIALVDPPWFAAELNA
jgi:hypothetical protein